MRLRTNMPRPREHKSVEVGSGIALTVPPRSAVNVDGTSLFPPKGPVLKIWVSVIESEISFPLTENVPFQVTRLLCPSKVLKAASMERPTELTAPSMKLMVSDASRVPKEKKAGAPNHQSPRLLMSLVIPERSMPVIAMVSIPLPVRAPSL